MIFQTAFSIVIRQWARLFYLGSIRNKNNWNNASRRLFVCAIFLFETLLSCLHCFFGAKLRGKFCSFLWNSDSLGEVMIKIFSEI